MTTADLTDVGQDVPNEPLTPAQPKTRLKSLDIFRGMTIAGMLLVNNLSNEDHAYAPLLHSKWHGWTPTDLIFPFFMFIMGVAIPFSLAKRKTDPSETRGRMLGQIWLRGLSLVMLGMLVRVMFSSMPALPPGYAMLHVLRWVANIFAYASVFALLMPWRSRRLSMWLPPIVTVILVVLLFVSHFIVRHATDSGLSPDLIGSQIFKPQTFRIPGVLQRIGICYGIAASIALFGGWRTVLTSAILLLVVYSTLMFKAPFLGHEKGSLTHDDNLEGKIDEWVFDRYTVVDGKRVYISKHTYGDYADPEGLLSTIPAAATPLLGILLGIWLRTDRSAVEKCAAMLAMGVLVAVFGACLGSWLMPINKKIWSPSFVVFTAGLAMLGLGAIFWIVDVKGRSRWALPFTIFGMNSIAAYVGSDVILRISQLIKVHGVELSNLVETHAINGVVRFSGWLQTISPHFPVIGTPANLTMVFAIVLIFATLVVLTPLYVFKIYLKV